MATERYHVNARIIDVITVKEDLALGPAVGNQIVHSVEATQQGAFSAPGGTDEGRHLVLVKLSEIP